MAFRRVLVVDDSPIARKVVSDVVLGIAGVSDVVTASNGRLALERLAQDRFDLVILDVEMPELDGIGALRAIRVRFPSLPVLMFSALTERAGTLTLEALALGARDYLTKPSTLGPPGSSVEHLRLQLADKIRGILPHDPDARDSSSGQNSRQHKGEVLGAAHKPVVAMRGPRSMRAELLAIGASTGGPVALTELLAKMPADLSVPIVIVQHMPPFFTKIFAKRLDEVSALRVQEAEDGAELLPGTAWLAVGDQHASVRRVAGRLVLGTSTAPPENSCRPSVDVLFRSVAETCGPASVGVVLTGMGEDGMRGARLIRARGGRVIAQDEPTSVVWGMPGAVVREGLADRVEPLEDIAGAMLDCVRSSAIDPGRTTTVEERR